MLNLALTNHPDCGWQLGKMANVIGDSGAGKTLLCLTALAEAAHDPTKEDVDLYFDDAENALEFDLSAVFGEATQERVELIDPPSNNVEGFSDQLALAIRKGNRFVFVEDSFDALGCIDDDDHYELERKIRLGESKKESKGSYGMGKPKFASQFLRQECGKLKRSNGACIIISQTRDNLTPGSFEKKTRSGGKALKFYATHEVWVLLLKQFKDNKHGLRTGAEAEIKVTKNKITGKRRSIRIDILDDYGLDDIGSMIDFLVDDIKCWTGTAAKYDTKGDLGIDPVQKVKNVNTGGISREKLINLIESEQWAYDGLKAICSEEWNKREAEVKPNRKPRYGNG
jgi:RecA/RadA recombinase